MRRVYKTASADGNIVVLDDKPLRTPAGHDCNVPTPQLADAIATEWNAQGDVVKPATMPLTQLTMTAIDRIPALRDGVTDDVLRYLGTELICHYADTPAVAAFQRQRWQPLHDWLKTKFDVVLPVTTALVALPESDGAWAALHIAGYDDFHLCALQQAVSVSGSFVIGLALVERAVDAVTALDAAEAEADHQASQWGSDADNEVRRAGQLADLQAVERFIALV